MGILQQTPPVWVCVTLVWLKDLSDQLADCNCWPKLLDPPGNCSSPPESVPLSHLSGDRPLCVQELSVSVSQSQDPGSNSSLSLCLTLFKHLLSQESTGSADFWLAAETLRSHKTDLDMPHRKLAPVLVLYLRWTSKVYRKHKLTHLSWGRWREGLSPSHVVRYDCNIKIYISTETGYV